MNRTKSQIYIITQGEEGATQTIILRTVNCNIKTVQNNREKEKNSIKSKKIKKERKIISRSASWNSLREAADEGLLLFLFRGRGSPWGVSPFDCGWKLCLNEKLEMRNAKWWCGARSFDSVLTALPLHDRTSDISLRSGWRNAPRSINNGDAMSWHASH